MKWEDNVRKVVPMYRAAPQKKELSLNTKSVLIPYQWWKENERDCI